MKKIIHLLVLVLLLASCVTTRPILPEPPPPPVKVQPKKPTLKEKQEMYQAKHHLGKRKAIITYVIFVPVVFFLSFAASSSVIN